MHNRTQQFFDCKYRLINKSGSITTTSDVCQSTQLFCLRLSYNCRYLFMNISHCLIPPLSIFFIITCSFSNINARCPHIIKQQWSHSNAFLLPLCIPPGKCQISS